MKLRFAYALLVCPLLFTTARAADEGDRAKAIKHITESATILNEIMSAPDKGIPQEILEKAQCVVVVPGLKRVGFFIGAKYGRGVLSCRTDHSNQWSAPDMIRVEGGSIGAQIGAGETDLVLVVMNKGGEAKLLQSKFTLGADAAAMGGPVGRSASAETDAQMHAQILSYSRSRGAFAGVTLGGATLRPESDLNAALYGPNVTPQQIVEGNHAWPAGGTALQQALRHWFAVAKQ